MKWILVLALAFVVGFSTQRESIVISKKRVQELREAFIDVHQVEPNPQQTQAMIRQDVEDELLYREARHVGEDRRQDPKEGSPLFKKLMVQKMKLLLSRSFEPEVIREEEIQAYYQKHRAQFMASPDVTFRQIFVQNSKDSKRITGLLRDLNSGKIESNQWTKWSDPFSMGLVFRSVSRSMLSRRFGERFTQSVFDLPLQKWTQIESPFGVHLIRVDARAAEKRMPIESVRTVIVQEISRERERGRLDYAMKRLKEKYSVSGF